MSFAAIVRDLQRNSIPTCVAKKKQSIREAQSGACKQVEVLLPILQNSVTEIVQPPKADDYFRMSTIPYMCARAEVLCAVQQITRENTLNGVKQLIFGIGSKVHDLLQKDILGDLRILYGIWICDSCQHEVEGTKPTRCEQCGLTSKRDESYEAPDGREDEQASFSFKEEYVHNEDLNYGGHPDGTILNAGERLLLEIKTIRGDLFHKLHEPYHEHVVQASGYAELKGYDKILFVYVNKNGRNDQDFLKEFLVLLDKKLVEREIHDKVRLIRQGIRDSEIPERTECFNKSSKKAKYCPVKQQCFAK